MKSVFLVLLLSIAFAQAIVRSLTLYPVADSILRNDYPTTNYGTILNSPVFQDWGADDNSPTGVIYELVTMFNINSTVVPGPILSANIYYTQQNRVQGEVIGPSIVFDYYETYTNWTETTVTWNKKPTVRSLVASNYQDGNVDNVIMLVTNQTIAAQNRGSPLVAFWATSIDHQVPVNMRESPLNDQYGLPVRPYMSLTYQSAN